MQIKRWLKSAKIELSILEWIYVVIKRRHQWKLFLHLIFRTYHFGVNNDWWVSEWNSDFGLPIYKRFFYIRESLNGIARRCGPSVGFIEANDARKLFPHRYGILKYRG